MDSSSSSSVGNVLPGVPDYSTVHKAIGTELFSPIQDKSKWNELKLSQDLVDEFWREGYISNIPILTPDQCDLILQDYRYFTDENAVHPGLEMMYEFQRNQSGDPENVLLHALGHWRLTKLFHDLIFHPKAVVPASQLVCEGQERAVRFWHDQLFAKPAKHGGVVAWHQDYSYWTRTSPMMHLTVHIALDEQTEENGALKYLPGSHRWTRNGGQPLPVIDFDFKDMEGIKTILTDDELADFKPKSSMLKKGEASFHHPLMVHGSYGNKSQFPRRAAVLNYFADGVCSNVDGIMLKKLDSASAKYEAEFDPETNTLRNGNPKYDQLFGASNIQKGKKMQGQFYPLVYDPAWTR